MSAKDIVTPLLSMPIKEKRACDDDSDEENSEPKSPTNGLGKYVAFMALSNISFVQGLSDKDSKSDRFYTLGGKWVLKSWGL